MSLRPRREPSLFVPPPVALLVPRHHSFESTAAMTSLDSPIVPTASAAPSHLASISPPAQPPTLLTTALTYAGRTIRQYIRTPQLLVVNAATSVMFLLIFRYVFGGAIGTGGIEYVNFLIPALAAIAGMFASGVVGVAEDAESGFFDRLRSLPVPRAAVVLGRSLADTASIMWGSTVSIVVGFLVGFRISGGWLGALGALGLCVVFAFTLSWVQILLGLVAGSAQAAQGLSFALFPLIFVSSAYVPVESMPGWLQPIAENQPVTAMVGATRALVLGGNTEQLLGHSTTWFVARSLLWCLVITAVCATLSVRTFTRR
jgi:ABC-2 type transport system permease protein